jgi:hypothetical protein
MRPGGEEPATLSGEPVLVEKASVALAPDRGLFDTSVLRTLFLQFDHEDWHEELTAFYGTDVEVSANGSLDGEDLKGILVRYRGNSSFMMTGTLAKKSLNLSFGRAAPSGDLKRYQTLNLLNGHSDPSYLREVLFSDIHGKYICAPKANLIHVVINGESYGIYVSVQQINKQFLKENFGSSEGYRFKVPANFDGASGLADLGQDLALYKRRYQLKSGSESDAPFSALQEFCQVLQETSAEQLPYVLPLYMNVDEWLWFLALDLVFQDDDGYHSRASDYELFLDKHGVFHPITRDNNETFRFAGGGPGNRGGAPAAPMVAPLYDAERGDRPISRALLSVPAWRARYLSFVRTLAIDELQWELMEPRVRAMQKMIAPWVEKDRRALSTFQAFVQSLDGAQGGLTEGQPPRGRGPVAPSLRSFVTARREFLLSHEDLAGPWPRIASVSVEEGLPGGCVRVRVSVPEAAAMLGDTAILHVAFGKNSVFREEPLSAEPSSHSYVSKELPLPSGKDLRFFVEVRSASFPTRVTTYPKEAGARPRVVKS